MPWSITLLGWPMDDMWNLHLKASYILIYQSDYWYGIRVLKYYYEPRACLAEAPFWNPCLLQLNQFYYFVIISCVATSLWGKCEEETHTPKSGNWESFGTPHNFRARQEKEKHLALR